MAPTDSEDQQLSFQAVTSDPLPRAESASPAQKATTNYGIMRTLSERPSLLHAKTSTVLPDTAPAMSSNLSRPLITRAATTTTLANNVTAQKPTRRPGILRRIATQIDATLELSTGASSYTQRKRSPQPSHWTDHAHREALLQIWDSLGDASQEPSLSVAAKLAVVQKNMLIQFAELKEGEMVLSREWIESVLGVALRHPFCAEGAMGRWEVLSGAAKVGGVRAWGPW